MTLSEGTEGTSNTESHDPESINALPIESDDQDSDQNEEFSDSISFATEFHFTPLDPVALLMDELKHEETAIRVNAVSHLIQISESLGAERSRSELIPFLIDSCTDEDDEVMLAMAVELPKLVPLLGGPTYAHLLVDILGKLAGEEDLDLRMTAINSLSSLGSLFIEESFREAVFQTILSLQEHYWFTRKQSAILLSTKLFANFNGEQQKVLVQMILSMLDQDLTVVKKCVAENLPTIIGFLQSTPSEGNELVDWNEIVQVVTKITQDRMDGVKMYAVHSIAALVGKVSMRGDLIPLLIELLKDTNWRIKYVICEKFPDLFTYFQYEPFDQMDYVNYFVKYCADGEAEVRASAVMKLPFVMEQLIKSNPNDFIPLISPIILLFSTSLSTDPSGRVRVEFARIISDVCKLIGADLVDKFDLLSLYRQLLLNDSSDVRLVLLQNLSSLHQSIGIDRISSVIVDALTTLSTDHQWRVRMSFVQFLPSVSQYMGVAFFDQSLSPLLLHALGDHVWSVREAALGSFSQLVGIFGSHWASSAIQIYLKFLTTNSNYLFRSTALDAIEHVAHLVPLSLLDSNILPCVRELLADPVPNVRLAACRCLGNISTVISSCSCYSELSDLLKDVANNDEDVDVKYFAQESITKMKQ